MAEILHKDLIGDDIHELRVTISSQPPNIIPKFVGQGLYDIVNKKFYVAQGTTLLTDWVTTAIPPFLIFADTRTIKWTSNLVGTELTYQGEVDEAELILTAANITDFSNAVLTLPEVISLLADQHTRLILRTGAEPGGWAPEIQDGLELDPSAQKIKLSQNLSSTGNPTFDEVTLTIRSKTPLLTLTAGGVSTAASAFLDTAKGVVVRGDAGSASSFTLQNEAGTDVLSNPVSSNQLVAPSLAMNLNAPGVVHANADGLLSASKLVDADVDAAAAIAGTKIVPDFGSQNITTTGSLLVDTIESNTDDISILAGNSNKTIAIGTGSGFNTINLGGLNSTVNISGATYTTPIDYVSEDKNIVVNFNASGQDSPDSGLYVQEEFAGAQTDLTDATWQSGNTVRYTVDSLGNGVGALIAGEFLRITGFSLSDNNGTFKVLTVDSAYVDVVNPKRTDGSADETGAAALGARLILNGYIHVGSDRMSWEVRAPAHLGIIQLKPQAVAKNLQITSESTDDVTVKFNTNLTVDQDLQKTSSVEFANIKVADLGVGVVHSDVDGNFSSSTILNADVDGAAAIEGTKIVPDFGSQNITTTGDATAKSLKVTGAEPVGGATLSSSPTSGVLVRGQAGTASQFKFISDLGTSLVTITDNGTVTLHNLSTTGVVKSTAGVLSSNLLVDADVSATAAIAGSKIQEASATNPGVVSTTAQAFAGDKTFNGTVSISGFGTAGVVHNSATGLLSTSLIMNADVDASAAISATKLANQPSGNISSTTVQAAINELDTEKVAKTGDSLTGSLSFATNTGVESSASLATLNVGSSNNTSVLNVGTGDSVSAINIGTGSGVTTINIGGTGDTININGTLNSVNTTNTEVADKNIVLNRGGAAASAGLAGLDIEENASVAAYVRIDGSRASWDFKAPSTSGSFKITPSSSAFSAEIAAPTLASNTVYTLPSTTDTLVGRATTDTLSNKTLINPIIDKITPYNVDKTFTVDSTAAIKLPLGTNTDRSAFTGADGMIRYNTSLVLFEGYSNGKWDPLAGNATTVQVTQTAHGFVPGDAIYLNGSSYTKGIATATNTAQIVGLVSRVIDVDNFQLTLSGDVIISGWGLTPGTVYFLSATSAGLLSATEPTVAGQASTQVGVARTSNALYVDIKRPTMVGSANVRTTIPIYNNTSTNVLDISGYTSFVLEGELNVIRSPGANQRAYYTVEAAKKGAGVWDLDVRYSGDDILYATLPVWGDSSEQLTLTMPLVTDFVSSNLTYSLNAPSIGASLKIDSTAVYTNYKSVSSAYAATPLDDYISAQGGTQFNITLPSAVGLTGKTFLIKSNMNTGILVVVVASGTQTIDGASSVTLSKYSSLHIVSNGANWEIF